MIAALKTSSDAGRVLKDEIVIDRFQDSPAFSAPKKYFGHLKALGVYPIHVQVHDLVIPNSDPPIKIAGHKLGTIEVESALLHHPAIAEAGAIGRPDELRGEVVAVFAVLRQGYRPSEQMRQELLDTVRHWLGPVAVIGEINFVSTLPKTMSRLPRRSRLIPMTDNAA